MTTDCYDKYSENDNDNSDDDNAHDNDDYERLEALLSSCRRLLVMTASALSSAKQANIQDSRITKI